LVRGGKSHPLLVHRLGVSAGLLSQPAYRFAIHLRQPRRLPHAASFMEMFQNRQTLLLGQLRAE
jgi:hypothetical protein